MTQEYLFSDKSKKAEIEKYTPNDVNIEITDIQNSDCWIISYSTSHDSRTAAKKLSEIDGYIVQVFQPTVLANESAAYFNRTLYPLANEFERKLRKLLYLKSALNPSEKSFENIKDLESKKLGEIFQLLFTDNTFVKRIRTRINSEMTWPFTKAELHNAINEIQEDTVWEHLVGAEAVPKLWEYFADVKKYRNDIMHAHNMNFEIFQKAEKLFKDINQQLDSEIGKIIEIAEKSSSKASASNYNIALSVALTNINHLANLAKQIQEAMALSPALLELQELATSLSKIPSYQLESISKLSKEMTQDLSNFGSVLPETDRQITNIEETPEDK